MRVLRGGGLTGLNEPGVPAEHAVPLDLRPVGLRYSGTGWRSIATGPLALMRPP